MAATVTVDAGGTFVVGDRKISMGTLQLGSYATSGVAVVAADVGLSVLQHLTIENGGGLDFEYDKANGLVLAYDGGTEVANATDISANVARYVAIGK